MLTRLDPRVWHAGAMNLVQASNERQNYGYVVRPAANALATATGVAALATQIFAWIKDAGLALPYIPGATFGYNLNAVEPWIRSSNKLGNYAIGVFVSLLAIPLSIVSQGISRYNTQLQHRNGLFANPVIVEKLQKLDIAISKMKTLQTDAASPLRGIARIFEDHDRFLQTAPTTNAEFDLARKNLSDGVIACHEGYNAILKELSEAIKGVEAGYLTHNQRGEIKQEVELVKLADNQMQNQLKVHVTLLNGLNEQQNAFNNKLADEIQQEYQKIHQNWTQFIMGNFISTVANAYKMRHTNTQGFINELKRSFHDVLAQKLREMGQIQNRFQALDFSRNPESPYKHEMEATLATIAEFIDKYKPLCDSIVCLLGIALGMPNKQMLGKIETYQNALKVFESAAEHPKLQLHK